MLPDVAFSSPSNAFFPNPSSQRRPSVTVLPATSNPTAAFSSLSSSAASLSSSSSSSSSLLGKELSPVARKSRRHRVTVASTSASHRSSSHVTPPSSSSSSSSSLSTPAPASPTRPSATATDVTTSPSPLSKSSSPSSTSTSPSPPPTSSRDSRERLRASSPNSKSRYISRLRGVLQSQCAQSTDAFWSAMQAEARDAAENEPLLASFLFSTVLNHPTLYSALAFHLANKLTSPSMPSTMLMRMFQGAMLDDDDFCRVVRQDLLAYMERDPACSKFIDALLYFKGFHALQTHRVAHILWGQGRVSLAYHLQSQVSKELQVDIHPAARIGAGAFLDHATGIVIGETAAIGDNCSLLHHVTLGGSGKKHGDRHPKLGDGVLVGAGATLLGNVRVGDGAQIGACSLVLEDVPPGATVVGVPAKIVRVPGVAVPAVEMKHERCLPGCTNENHGHPVPASDVSQDSSSSSS